MWLPEVEIEIVIPQAPFRIHPDPARSVGPLLCTYEQGEWWLAHPEGVTPRQIGVASWTRLYEGVMADGTSFLMPVYRYTHEDEDDPENFLSAAVEFARSHWVRIEGVLHQDECRIVPAEVDDPGPIEWSPYGFADLVDIGFGGRYLGSRRDVAVRLNRRREFVAHTPLSLIAVMEPGMTGVMEPV